MIQIAYDSKTIDLLTGPEGLRARYLVEKSQNRSGSGKYVETLVHYAGFEGALDCYFQQAAYEAMVAWWSWAMQGKAWSLAMDSTDTVSTTLDGAAAAGQKVIPLAATAGLAAGDKCLIRSADRITYEIVEIDSVSAGVSITAEENLKQSYVSGDGFRHLDYFPACVLADDEDAFDPDKSGAFYRTTIPFIEVAA